VGQGLKALCDVDTLILHLMESFKHAVENNTYQEVHICNQKGWAQRQEETCL
jgi:hypothetical protein